jgi:glycine/D-amino acid oxidase-like deaminating enzyme
MDFIHLSFWEKKWLTDEIDFLIVGAGIVGISCAFHLKKAHPKSKVLIIDKGALPFSATSKNAGFACFGSPSEILSDLKTSETSTVWSTLDKRWRGLKALENWLGKEAIDLQINGSWDLMNNTLKSAEIRDNLSNLNLEIEEITGVKNVYSEDKEAISQFGFQKLDSTFKNKLEGQIDTSSLNSVLHKKAAESNIHILRGVDVLSFQTNPDGVTIETNLGQLKCANLVFCTNGFSHSILPELNVQPARAQILITKPIEKLRIKGTFHFDEGYFYFRNFDNRLLIGGGRNHNFQQENTSEIALSDDIQNSIEQLLKTVILPDTFYEIDHRWAGIMGVGNEKNPIVKRINNRVCAGVRMGGMGVAIGTLIGKELAELHS